MAKRGILEHEKTMMLADELGIMEPFAVGLLEVLWHWVAKNRPDGDMTGLKPALFARAIRYSGDGAELLRAYIAAGFIDVLPCGCMRLHQWSEHSDDAVDNALARSLTWYADGTMPRMRRLAKDERDRLTAAFQQPAHAHAFCVHTVRTGSAQYAPPSEAVSALPEPEPVPEPVNTPPTPSQARGRDHKPAERVDRAKHVASERTVGMYTPPAQGPPAFDPVPQHQAMLEREVDALFAKPERRDSRGPSELARLAAPRSLAAIHQHLGRPASMDTLAASRAMLQHLYALFQSQFNKPALEGDGWEDSLAAWQRCFEPVSVGDVEMDGESTVVYLVTPRPRDLADGLSKFEHKVRTAMKKAFGHEVQLVPRDAAVAA